MPQLTKFSIPSYGQQFWGYEPSISDRQIVLQLGRGRNESSDTSMIVERKHVDPQLMRQQGRSKSLFNYPKFQMLQLFFKQADQRRQTTYNSSFKDTAWQTQKYLLSLWIGILSPGKSVDSFSFHESIFQAFQHPSFSLSLSIDTSSLTLSSFSNISLYAQLPPVTLCVISTRIEVPENELQY